MIVASVTASVNAALGIAQANVQQPEEQLDEDQEDNGQTDEAIEVHAPVPAQISWIKLLETYQKNRPPTFKGETDGMTVQKWLENVKRLVDALDADPIQM